jgi:hypothetical protein
MWVMRWGAFRVNEKCSGVSATQPAMVLALGIR